ncbi:MAG: glycosyltransferase family 9 protein [Candidatus Methylacidiphilales bacterium]|nr:glycosyltransferase family 9 protein [Candidatus Methylacidiphilales bacterium]
MKVSSMRIIDALVGIPLCTLLTAVSRIQGMKTGRYAHQTGDKMVFLKLAEQGSTVLAQSTLEDAVSRFGRENVYFLLFAENRFILDYLRIIPPENVLEIDHDSLTALVTSTFRQVFRLWKLRVAVAVDLEFFARATAVLSFLTGARTRVGFHAYHGAGAWRGNLLTHRVHFNSHVHTSISFHSLINALDLSPEEFPTYRDKAVGTAGEVRPLPCDPGVLERVRQMLARVVGPEGSGGLPLILLNSNCSDLLPLRRWPDDRYVELARRLLAQRPELHIAFTGGPSEREGAEALVSKVGHPRCFCLAGCTTLEELMALYHLAEVLVTNDSGPAHFSSLTPIDSVVLFGPETPALFGVQSERSHPIWVGLPCSPCVSAYNGRMTSCRDNQCLQQISVEQVYQKVMAVYEKRTQSAQEQA